MSVTLYLALVPLTQAVEISPRFEAWLNDPQVEQDSEIDLAIIFKEEGNAFLNDYLDFSESKHGKTLLNETQARRIELDMWDSQVTIKSISKLKIVELLKNELDTIKQIAPNRLPSNDYDTKALKKLQIRATELMDYKAYFQALKSGDDESFKKYDHILKGLFTDVKNELKQSFDIRFELSEFKLNLLAQAILSPDTLIGNNGNPIDPIDLIFYVRKGRTSGTTRMRNFNNTITLNFKKGEKIMTPPTEAKFIWIKKSVFPTRDGKEVEFIKIRKNATALDVLSVFLSHSTKDKKGNRVISAELPKGIVYKPVMTDGEHIPFYLLK